jgi:predicted secreted hydrolase
MIYVIRNDAGPIGWVSRACRIDERGSEECVPYSEIDIEILGHWRSPDTGALYPYGWRISKDEWDLDLTIVPVSAAQEFPQGPVKYWEGSCKVLGSHTGRAYIELVGYD